MRGELVELLRSARYLDQAGRYAIGIDGYATSQELRAYGAMLRGLKAGDDRMRELSLLPADFEVSAELREAMKPEARSEVARSEESSGCLVQVAWWLVASVVLVVLPWTFVTSLTDPTRAREVALSGCVVVMGAATLASATTAFWCGWRRSWPAAGAWSVIGALSLAAAILITFSL